MTAPAIDWGPIDPADWEPTVPPDLDANGELAWLYAIQKILADREERMDRARKIMRKAYDAWAQARDEFDAAAEMLETEAREYARRGAKQ